VDKASIFKIREIRRAQ